MDIDVVLDITAAVPRLLTKGDRYAGLASPEDCLQPYLCLTHKRENDTIHTPEVGLPYNR